MAAAAAQGTSLLRDVRELELIAERNVSSRLSGNYLTTYRGTGLDFHEARKYIPGESVRRIDWRMTARMREPYVQVHHEERQREIVLAIDVSSSMRCGWQQRTKLETAIEAAATLAVAATRAGDKLGFLTYSHRVHRRRPPRSGRRALFGFLREASLHLAAVPERSPHSDTRAAIHSLEQLRAKRMVIFIVSDFHEADLADDLRYLSRHHDTTLLRIVEPLEELASPRELRRHVVAAEGNARRSPLLSAPRGSGLRQTYADATRARRVHHIELDTQQPVGPALQRAFHLRQHRGDLFGTRRVRGGAREGARGSER